MKVVITPCAQFVPGMVQRILGDIAPQPLTVDASGKVHAELNPAQLAMFQLKGAAHQVTIVPDEAAAVPPAEAATFSEAPAEKEADLTITIETSPGVRQTMKVGPSGLEPIPEALTPVAGSQTPVKGSEAKSA